MAKTKNEKDRRTNRLMLSLTADEHNQLDTLAKVIGKPPAVVVREILTDFLSTRSKEIAEANRAAAAYHASIKNLNVRQTSLFTEEDV